jgi:hypothetical protein
MLRARTCALGWDRQRMVVDKRHCKIYSVRMLGRIQIIGRVIREDMPSVD